MYKIMAFVIYHFLFFLYMISIIIILLDTLDPSVEIPNFVLGGCIGILAGGLSLKLIPDDIKWW